MGLSVSPPDPRRWIEPEEAAPELPRLEREDRPLIWVRTRPELEAAVAALMSEPVVGLDVETTLTGRALCLVQVAGGEATYLIDALEAPDLEPLGALLSRPRGTPSAKSGRPTTSKSTPSAQTGRPTTAKSTPSAQTGRPPTSKSTPSAQSGFLATAKSTPSAQSARPTTSRSTPSASRGH